MNYIIVEDDLIVQLFMEEILEKLDIKDVNTFSSTESAIELLHRVKFESNIAFIDYSLEGNLNGVDLAKYIDSNCPNTYYYFVTANDHIIKNNTYGKGCLGIIAKPISEETIIQKIKVSSGL